MADENFDTFVGSRGAAGVLVGTEPIPCVSGGNTKQTTPDAIKTYVGADPAGSAAAAQAAAEAASDPVGSAAAAQAAAEAFAAAQAAAAQAAAIAAAASQSSVDSSWSSIPYQFFSGPSGGAVWWNGATLVTAGCNSETGANVRPMLAGVTTGALVVLFDLVSNSYVWGVIAGFTDHTSYFDLNFVLWGSSGGSPGFGDQMRLYLQPPGVSALASSLAAAAQAAAIAASDPVGSAAAAQAAAIAASDPVGSAAAAQAAAIAASDPAGSAAAAQAAAIAASDPVGSAAAAQAAANAHTDGFFAGAFSGTGAFTNFTFVNGVCTAAS